MKLKQVFDNVVIRKAYNFKNVDIKGISIDSRYLNKGEAFIALKGSSTDGHLFIEDAIGHSAACLVIDYRKLSLLKQPWRNNIITIVVADTKCALIQLAANFYKRRIRDLKLIGVTGTDGKTTITYLIESILNAAGFKTALIGTIEYHLPAGKEISINTTPSLIELYKYFLEMKKADIDYCIIEVSSHALDQDRVGDLQFFRAVFSNISRDHLDYHKNFKNYFAAKRKLFSKLAKGDSCAIINVDDAYGKRLLRKKLANKLSYGLKSPADVGATDISLNFEETKFSIRYKDEIFHLKSKLLGLHNVYNILAATALSLSMNIKPAKIIQGVKSLKEVAGRLQKVGRHKNVKIFIDYAHTPRALKTVLRCLEILRDRIGEGRVILVFGCGGERDKIKRPQMGRVASCFSDLVILTTDNPRSESPDAIIEDIKKGVVRKNFMVIKDRYKAIKKAFLLARDKDIVLIAGKGHERLQIFNNRIVDFDDAKAVRRILKEQ